MGESGVRAYLNDGGASGWNGVATQPPANLLEHAPPWTTTTIVDFCQVETRSRTRSPIFCAKALANCSRPLLKRRGMPFWPSSPSAGQPTAARRSSRSGYHPERAVQTGIGPVTVKVPKVRAKDGRPVAFRSALVPPYVRKAKSIEAALPWLYLKGISTGEMDAALKALLGPDATGFSAKTISRLKGQWAAEYEDWRRADLSRDDWVYIWADGIYSGLRGADDRLCVLVVIGVNARGQKHFLAIEDGVRESTQSWREVLLALKHRGLSAPKLATGDGAMGFWAALEEVFPNDTPTALLDAQDGQCAELPSQTHPAQGQKGSPRYLAGRDTRGGAYCIRSVH
jgi:putative transposase